MAVTFGYHGRRLKYEDHPYNSTRWNERAVELAVARDFISRRQVGAGLEVGNVLGHYGMTGHRVVDRYEDAPGVEALDVFEIPGRYDWIVSISTVEHVRHDPPEAPNPAGAGEAIVYLRSLLLDGGALLVTVPIGWNPGADEAIRDGRLEPTREIAYVRNGADWAKADPRGDLPAYGLSTPWAEAVWVAEWEA